MADYYEEISKEEAEIKATTLAAPYPEGVWHEQKNKRYIVVERFTFNIKYVISYKSELIEKIEDDIIAI